MKKILIAIIVVMLIAAMSITLFACDKKDDSGSSSTPTNTNNPGGEDDPGTDPNPNPNPGGDDPTENAITYEELGDYEAATEQMIIYADQYLTNYATDKENVSASLKKALNAEAATVEGKIFSAINVTLDADNCYTLTFTYKDGKTYTYHEAGKLQARKAKSGVYAGYEMGTTKVDFDKSLGKVYNAFLRTVQKVLQEAETFGDDYKASALAGIAQDGYTFGGTVEAAFTFNYGEGDGQIGPVSYGLRVYGTLSYDAAKTQVAIEVIDESKDTVVGGLYYKDTTLYLAINAGDYQQKLYLDDADINAILGDVLGDSFSGECDHNYVDGYCTECGKLIDGGACVDEQGNYHKSHKYDASGACEYCGAAPFYMHAPTYDKFSTALSDLMNGNEMVGTIVSLVKGVFTSTSTAIDDATVRYQYQLDLGKLISDLLGGSLGKTISDALNPIIQSIMPQLDLGGFQGIGGKLMLSFDVVQGEDKDGDAAELLSGVQIAYNVAQKDFRWNKNDAEPKVYGPVNVAITVCDFSIGDTEVDLDTEGYTYFSPLNGEIRADIEYADANDEESDLNGKYELIARADFNPFTLFAGDETREGAAEIILKKENGTDFFHVVIDGFTYTDEAGWDSTVTVFYGGKYYKTQASQSDFFHNVFEDFILPLVARDSESNLAPISEYVWELIDQFYNEYTADEFDADVEAYEAEIDALAVTRPVTETYTDAEGTEVTEIVVDDDGEPIMMPSSKWLDDIKAKALNDIAAVKNAVDRADEESLKAAKKEIAAIVKQAKKDYSAQLKLEGKNDSIFEGFDIIGLVSNVKGLAELFVKDGAPADPKVFNYVLDFSDPQLHVDVDYVTYNKVIAILRNAIPKLNDFTADAAKVKVEMNTKGFEGKLWVNVTYLDYEVDVVVNIKDCIADGRLASTCNMSADIKVVMPDEDGNKINYIYELTAAFANWDKDGGTITISFKEKDGQDVTAASDEFVNMVITQKWNGEEYQGFDVVLGLDSRKNDGTAMNGVRTYYISGYYADGIYYLGLDFDQDAENSNGILLGIGDFDGGFDFDDTLSFDIPAPWCNVTFKAAMGEKDVTLKITNLRITNWGKAMTGSYAIEGINLQGKDVITNTAEDKAMDEGLFDVVEDLFRGFFYIAK